MNMERRPTLGEQRKDGTASNDRKRSVPESKSASKIGSSDLRLKIKIIAGRGLARRKGANLSNPYCTLLVGTNKIKTKVLSKTVDPNWEEEFTLGDVPQDGQIHIECWHEEFLKDSFLGQLDINFPSFGDEGVTDEWYALEGRGKDEVISGELHIRCELTSTDLIRRKYMEKGLK